MKRDTTAARRIIALQDGEGKWGGFHSLSAASGDPLTTEQALRRLRILGYTEADECIRRALAYMNGCLLGQREIPDRREKPLDWDAFTRLMLAAQIRLFTRENPAANAVAAQWAGVLTAAFAGGAYDGARYTAAYRDLFGALPRGRRLVDFVSFYPIALLPGCLDAQTEIRLVDYVLRQEEGLYYVYGKALATPPPVFASLLASRYLYGIELLARYEAARPWLCFVADWLLAQRGLDGRWDMGPGANDGIHFPLSENWRRRETRIADCTERVSALLHQLEGRDA